MFRKEIDVKSCTLLKTSEKKKFRSLVAATFFRQSDDPVAKGESEDDDAMPSNFRSSLVKGEVALMSFRYKRAAADDNGHKQFEFYTLDGTPVFFLEDGRLYPTVFLLWTLPNLLPRIYTHAEVFEKLKTGADLMLPGVITSEPSTHASFDFPVNAVCSVCVVGNDAAMAIGRTVMSGAEMLACEVRKGKAVHILHTYQDHLWQVGPKTRAPTITLPRQSQEQEKAEGNIDNAAAAECVENALTLEHDTNPAQLDDGDDSSQTPALDNDTLFLLYFLYALQKRFRRDDELPALASTFYGSVLLPLMPSEGDKKIPVQRTTYKKFSVFLRAMQEEGVIAIEEPKKGVENIAQVNRDHEIFGRYAAQLKLLPTADTRQDPTDAASSMVNERPVNFKELRAITAPVLPLFHEVNKSLRKGQALSAMDVRSVITSYVKSKELPNGRMVRLDDLLLKCVTTSSKDQRAVGDLVTWEELMDKVFNKMTPCVEIEYADRGVSAAGGSSSRKEVRKGKPPSIRMRVAKRAGNKKVTMIDNVQEFGIDPKAFAQELQTALAVSATLNDSPGFAGLQVQVQGDQSAALQKILIEKYGIAKRYIQAG